MALTTRTSKGSPLTWAEGDANLTGLADGTNITGTWRSRGIADNATSTALTLNSTGIAYIGDATPITGQTALGAVISTNTATGSSLIVRKSAATVGSGSNVILARSRGTNASPTTAVSGDTLGSFSSYGYDGTNYVLSSQISTSVDNTISTGVVPGNLFIHTKTASGVTTEAFRIDSTQSITLGGGYTTPALKVVPVASQNRWITITGSNGANPEIGTNAGTISFTKGEQHNIAINNGATLTISDGHHTIIQNTQAAVYTLPSASTCLGRYLRIVNQFAGTITSAASDMYAIDGTGPTTTILPATSGKWVDLMSNGSGWMIVASN